MSISVEQRARRILNRMELFKWAKHVITKIPEPIADSEKIIGVYNLNGDNPRETIWISDNGIWICDDLWRLIRFDRISEIKFPQDKSGEEDSLTLLTLDETYEKIPIKGRHGRFRNVFEFGRFMLRVIEDLEQLRRDAGSGDS